MLNLFQHLKNYSESIIGKLKQVQFDETLKITQLSFRVKRQRN